MGEAQRKWAKANPERVAEIKRRFNERHKERLKQERSEHGKKYRNKYVAATKRWAQKNPDKAYMARVRARLRKMDKAHNRSLRFHYNVTADQYNRIKDAQSGLCAVCGKEQTSAKSKRLFVDHDHTHGHLRGLLCHTCNIGIGCFRDDVDTLKKAIAYLAVFEKADTSKPWDEYAIEILNGGRHEDFQ